MATQTARAELTRRQLFRALVASTVGSSIEWYDFLLYSSAASIYFGKLFFPSADPLAGTLAAFGTFFVGYAVRPVGALIFGHFGDRVGRKAALIATLLLMGLASFVAVALFEAFHGTTAIAIYTIAATALGLVALGLLEDRSRQDLGVEYDPLPGRGAAVRPELVR